MTGKEGFELANLLRRIEEKAYEKSTAEGSVVDATAKTYAKGYKDGLHYVIQQLKEYVEKWVG